MCIDCGCAPTDHHHHHDAPHSHEEHTVQRRKTISIEEDILAKNNRLAAANRTLFADKGIFTLNLVSSPGSGKTSLLEMTLSALKNEISFAVLEGDQQTANDADRIAATGVPVHQINTGAGCHLDAHMVGHGLEHFNLDAVQMLMIENVGNLVCPAAFDLGEDFKVSLLSVTEGEDKPLKYPQMFRASEIMLINKIDLLPYVRFDIARCREYAERVHPGIKIFEVSCYSGEGLDEWYAWLGEQVSAKGLMVRSKG
ncbi:hydrogenase nickel incorporation protein HypB [Geopsychrobacter electrodiphilus]|uniref:hydrogenase nickel incorporation protein HypB n=1 Tax=Geopsychrobacter electrodiphilus TaxID=225196 RepID=UPI0003638515|nr:hydrogenase nickel incorporation protein HypB [Geopsychrobacter electrodiphilus]